MEAHYPTRDEPATAEYVLAVFRDWHRQGSDGDPTTELTFDTTIEDWRCECDLVEWREFGRAMNDWWKIGFTHEEWHSAMEPEEKRHIGDVCQLIASRAMRPVIRPFYVFERSCLPAGVFLTVRSLLADAGAPADKITPSTPLAGFARRYCQVFTGRISQLMPGVLPKLQVIHPVADLSLMLIVMGSLFLCFGLCAGLTMMAVFGGVLCGLSHVLNWFAAYYLLPTEVKIGTLQTFRDLAVLMANNCPDNSGSGRGT